MTSMPSTTGPTRRHSAGWSQPSGQSLELAPARGVQRVRALREVRERDVAGLVDQPADLGPRPQSWELLPRETRRVAVRLAVERLHHAPDGRRLLAPDLL